MRFQVRALSTFVLSVLLIICTKQLLAQENSMEVRANADSGAIQEAISGFIDAFVNLDWERFRTSFADGATVFFPPSAKFARRANGRAEIESTFGSVFENARLHKSHAPYVDIHPKDVHMQTFGNVAIVTFHLEDSDWFGRRTIVLNKQDEKWLMVHLHASGIAVSR